MSTNPPDNPPDNPSERPPEGSGQPPQGRPDEPPQGQSDGGYPTYPSGGDAGGNPPTDYPSYGGYGASDPAYAGGPPTQFRVGDAIGYGWASYRANWAAWVGVSLLFVVIQVVVQGTASALGDSSYNGATFSAGSILFSLIGTVVGWLIQAAFTRGGLDETEGRKPGIGEFFRWSNPTNVILACLLVGVLSTIGFILIILPGIVFTFFAWYTLWFVIDDGQNPVDALRSSFSLVAKNAGPLFVFALACIGINIIGAILCLVGLLVTIPLTTIATGYSFKYLTGKSLAPSTAR